MKTTHLWILAVTFTMGCGSKDSSSAASASAATSSKPAEASKTASAAPAAATPAKGPTTKHTGKELYDVAPKGGEATDKALAAAKEKLGDPDKVDGDTSLWYGWAPKGSLQGVTDEDCIELKIGPKGSSVGGVDWKKCGMGG